MIEVYQAILDVLDAGEHAAVCTVVDCAGSSPQKVGSKMLVRADRSIVGTVGGGTIELAAIDQAEEVIREGISRLFKVHLSRDLAMCCGGRMEVFIEPVGDRPWLFLFGGGHVGAALCSIASQAGFRVHVIDEREEFASQEAHPTASATSSGSVIDLLDDLPWGSEAYAVIVTHSHALDADLLTSCLERPHRYLGMIGSRAKIHRFLKRFEQRGHARERFAGVRSPIGIDIGARDPGEIAVSIVAELIAVRRGRDANKADFARMSITAEAAVREET